MPATPVPDELHLAVDTTGSPLTVPFDRGRSSVFAYSVADDRPASRGTTTRPVSRQSLVDDERRGSAAVQVDAADGHVEGLPVVDPKRRGHGLLSIPPEHVRALRLTAAAGIWAEITSRESGADSAWKLLTTGADARTLCVVLDPDPDAWCTRAAAALGPRPHPEVTVVDSPDALPLAWRHAGRALLPTDD
ncbi:hypothetical protein [Curtobacterium sp. 'Ferrero']|uniref:hypothetical protein n=1 Tax=Curtobacterium sp. 'Ferrero' TaxID=2033654 RepID=UPI0011420A85|nr:hypothetical protein [Curtobacterium sp. 'Ferrero']